MDPVTSHTLMLVIGTVVPITVYCIFKYVLPFIWKHIFPICMTLLVLAVACGLSWYIYTDVRERFTVGDFVRISKMLDEGNGQIAIVQSGHSDDYYVRYIKTREYDEKMKKWHVVYTNDSYHYTELVPLNHKNVVLEKGQLVEKIPQQKTKEERK